MPFMVTLAWLTWREFDHPRARDAPRTARGRTPPAARPSAPRSGGGGGGGGGGEENDVGDATAPCHGRRHRRRPRRARRARARHGRGALRARGRRGRALGTRLRARKVSNVLQNDKDYNRFAAPPARGLADIPRARAHAPVPRVFRGEFGLMDRVRLIGGRRASKPANGFELVKNPRSNRLSQKTSPRAEKHHARSAPPNHPPPRRRCPRP